MYPGDTPGSEKPSATPVPNPPSLVLRKTPKQISEAFAEEGGEGRSGYGVSAIAGTEWSEFLRRWPVGQVVKTAASHAVNIGSNPVRVTTFFRKKELDN